MRTKANSTKWAESLAWKAVKGWVVLLLVWLTLPPIASKVSGRGENDLKTVLTGTIRAGQISPITLDFTARTISVAVKPGDVVEAGQLMAVLESAEVDDRLARARRRLELASARTDVRLNRPSQLLSQEQRRSAEQQRQEAQIRLAAYTLLPLRTASTNCPAFFYFSPGRIRRISGQNSTLCYLWRVTPVASIFTMK